MYCSNCNQYNDDRNRFCAFCGAPLQKQQTETPNAGSYQAQQPQSFGAPDEGSYQAQQNYQQPQQTYQQPWQPPQNELTKPITMATPVVSLILNIVFFNPVGLILAVLSLLNFNNYTSEKNRGAMENAETYKHKSKTFARGNLQTQVQNLFRHRKRAGCADIYPARRRCCGDCGVRCFTHRQRRSGVQLQRQRPAARVFQHDPVSQQNLSRGGQWPPAFRLCRSDCRQIGHCSALLPTVVSPRNSRQPSTKTVVFLSYQPRCQRRKPLTTFPSVRSPAFSLCCPQ